MSIELKFAICLLLLLVLVLIFNKTSERMHEFGTVLTNLDDSFRAQLKFTDPQSVERFELGDVLQNQYIAEQSVEQFNVRCPVDVDPLESKFMTKMGIIANHASCE